MEELTKKTRKKRWKAATPPRKRTLAILSRAKSIPGKRGGMSNQGEESIFEFGLSQREADRIINRICKTIMRRRKKGEILFLYLELTLLDPVVSHVMLIDPDEMGPDMNVVNIPPGRRVNLYARIERAT